MPSSILATKIFAPPSRSGAVPRPRLIRLLDGALSRKLTLVSASAGFGKTTLIGEWVAAREIRAAWISLDEGDEDPLRFLSYLIAALQTIEPTMGQSQAAVLRSPRPPAAESILASLINDIAAVPYHFALVLDDYHAADSKAVEGALSFLLERMPPTMHIIIATREDPDLPLARLRARDQLAELRGADLRFTAGEAADFLNRAMGLDLTEEEVAALEKRTEGWITGLQLAAIALRGIASGSA